MNIALNDSAASVFDALLLTYQQHINMGMTYEQARTATLAMYAEEVGGYQAVANQFRQLSGGKRYSRQGILGMWERSLEGKNDFPPKHSFVIVSIKTADVFDLRETGDWYRERYK